MHVCEHVYAHACMVCVNVFDLIPHVWVTHCLLPLVFAKPRVNSSVMGAIPGETVMFESYAKKVSAVSACEHSEKDIVL